VDVYWVDKEIVWIVLTMCVVDVYCVGKEIVWIVLTMCVVDCIAQEIVWLFLASGLCSEILYGLW